MKKKIFTYLFLACFCTCIALSGTIHLPQDPPDVTPQNDVLPPRDK